MVPFGAAAAAKVFAANTITTAWEDLEKQLLDELMSEGFSRDQITLRQVAYMRFYGQLDDLEVESPVSRLRSEGDMDRLIAHFEDLFTRTYTLAGKPPSASHLINEVAVMAQVETVKPVLLKYGLEGREPAQAALKGRRPVYQQGRWHDAGLYEMDELRPGNEVQGLAVIEAPSTTLFVPLGWHARLDEHLIFRLEREGY